MSAMIHGLIIEGDVTLKVPQGTFRARGRNRFTLAWRALMGKELPYPTTVEITSNVFKGKQGLKVEEYAPDNHMGR